MKGSIPLVLTAAAAMWLAGCVVQSVHPFYTQRDVVHDPALLGKWTAQDNDDYHWAFAPYETNCCYKLTITEESNSSEFVVHLFKLKGQYFLDGYELNSSETLLAPHHLMMVKSLSPQLEVVLLDLDWVKDYLEKKPRALKHTLHWRGESSYLLLTAETPELQKFIGKHHKNPEMWSEDALTFKKTTTN